MKISEDNKFVEAELRKLWPEEPAWYIAMSLRKCGEPIVSIGKKHYEKRLVYCIFMDGEEHWFPETCVEGYWQEEPMQITPDGTIAPVKTLRDEFAMAALGLMGGDVRWANAGEKYIAENAYEIADAMMEARKK